MIIHINGPSGSGKSKLGKRLLHILQNTLIIDTDDINDSNKLKELEKYSSFRNQKKINNFINNVNILNKKTIKKILSNNKNKNIIFVGLLHDDMKKLKYKINKTYIINIDAKTLWKQYNLRTINYINKNYDKIKKLLKSKLHPDIIHKILI